MVLETGKYYYTGPFNSKREAEMDNGATGTTRSSTIRLQKYCKQCTPKTKQLQKPQLTGPYSVVVSASDCRLEGLGFKSHQSQVGFFSPEWLTYPAQSVL